MPHPLFPYEDLVVDAWPAADTRELDGWLLRASGGPSRRANAVATLAVDNELSDEERITQAEAFYREHAQPALFQIGPAAQPKELDALLAARGYDKVAESWLMVAAPADLANAGGARELAVRSERKASAGWSQLALAQSRFADAQEVLRGILHRLGSRVRYLTVYADEQPIGSCYAIASEDRLGIYGMLSLPSARRRGAARALLAAIAESAWRDGARELYLMVEADNEPARALYAGSGFRDLYQYHYRLKAS